MSWVDRHIRSNIRDLKPYSSARDEGAGLEDLVFLDANEAPDETGFNRYPDPYQKDLRQALADRHGVPRERLMVGNGSDELIDLLIRAFGRPGSDRILITPPTYGVYSVMAGINELGVEEVSLRAERFDLDRDRILERLGANGPRILFLCSPNNPTGNRFSIDALRRLLEAHDGPMVVDEAYVDFADPPSLLPLLDEYENLVLLRTFSKARAAASLRAGYAIADPRLIEVLDRIKAPYNVNGLTQEKALELLKDEKALAERVERIRQERKKLADALEGMEAVEKVFPSEANFLLVRFKDPVRVLERTREAGLLIRDRRKLPLCEGCLRITLGDAATNERLLNAIEGAS